MSSDATPADVKTTCPFCTGRLSEHPAPENDRKGFLQIPTKKFVACPLCRSVFRLVPNWARLTFSAILFCFAMVFALLIVGVGFLIYWWLERGNQLSSFSILLFGLITAVLMYGGVRSSEQLFSYAFNSMMVLVSHPDLEKRD